MPTAPAHPSHTPLPPILAEIVGRASPTPAPIPVVARLFGWLSLHEKSGLRLALHGSHGVRLQTVKAGRRRLTTPAAFAQFLVEREVAAARERDPGVPSGLVLDQTAAGQVLAARGLRRGELRARPGQGLGRGQSN